jgi:hypothetical protein
LALECLERELAKTRPNHSQLPNLSTIENYHQTDCVSKKMASAAAKMLLPLERIEIHNLSCASTSFQTHYAGCPWTTFEGQYLSCIPLIQYLPMPMPLLVNQEPHLIAVA